MSRVGLPRLANPFVSLIAATAVSAALFAACGADRNGNAGADAGLAGADAFATNCAACHGPALQGTSVGPSLLSEVYKPDHHSDESIRNAVAGGVQPHHWNFGRMPALGLDTETVDAIIAHIRTTQTAEGFLDYPPTP